MVLNIFSGYRKQDAIGNTTLGLNIWYREQDRQYIVDELSNGHDVRGYEMHFRNKNGNRMYGLMSASILKSTENRVFYQRLVILQIKALCARNYTP